MSYNLLIDSELQNTDKSWTLVNCSYDNGILTSNRKIFGIKQKLILPNTTKVYYRFNYKLFNLCRVKIGIKVKDTLTIMEQHPSKTNINRLISIVKTVEDEEIEIHLIFESDNNLNKVEIFQPMLIDLNRFNIAFKIKTWLDRKIKYRKSYSYENCLEYPVINKKALDKGYWLSEGDYKIDTSSHGILLTIKDQLKIWQETKLEIGKYYLFKLDYKALNNFGNIYLSSSKLTGYDGIEQLYVVFKYNGKNIPIINIKANQELPFLVILKRALLIDISKLNLQKEDIWRLTYID